MRRVAASRAGLAAIAAACAGPQLLDTSCPEGEAAPEAFFAEMSGRGIPGSPDTARFRFREAEVVVGWKNLLSGRELTLSCAYLRQGDEWRLLRERLDEGTHALQVEGRESPPALIYRDARGRLLEVVPIDSGPEARRIR
jgi:hypothetical protein